MEGLKTVAESRMKKIAKASMELVKSIDMDVLIKGTGGEEHQRELYKLLAATGIKTEDLAKSEVVGLIKDVMT